MWIRISIVFIFAFSILCGSLSAQITTPFKAKTAPLIDIEAKINKMADDCWRMRESNTDSALEIGIAALDLAQKNNLAFKFPRLENFIGVIYIHYLHDTKSAIPYFHMAMENSMIMNDSIQLAYTYNNLGDAFMLTGNTPLALQYAKNSLKIFEGLKNLSGIAYGYINIGIINRIEKKYKLSLEYFYKAMDIRESISDSIGRASVIWELAKTYKQLGDLDKAMDYFQQSYIFEKALQNVRFTAACLNGIADICFIQEKYDLAAEYYSNALELNKSRNYLYGIIDDEIDLALVFANQGKIVEGEEMLQDALINANLLTHNTKILETYQSYAKFYQIIKDYKKSTQYFEQFFNMYDSILLIQQFETLNEIQKNFSIKHSLNQSQQEIENRKIENRFLLIIIALMIILVGGIVWRLRAHHILNQKLKLINQTKNKMFSVISHDLKSPFNSIIGFNSLLIKELNRENYDKVKEYANIVQNASKESLKLLTNLLDWSKTQSGKIEFNANNFLIEDLFIELKELFCNEAKKLGIQLEFLNSTKDKVFADKNILRIILINLVSNAFKYTHKDGFIKIEVAATSSEAVITVIDNGIGMSDEIKSTLFNDSYLIESSSGIRNEKGTGLGLSICEELIKIHKGSISVESEVNKGSKFEIRFPV